MESIEGAAASPPSPLVTLQPLPCLAVPDLCNGALALTLEQKPIRISQDLAGSSLGVVVQGVSGGKKQATGLPSARARGPKTLQQQAGVSRVGTAIRGNSAQEAQPTFLITNQTDAGVVMRFRLCGGLECPRTETPVVVSEQASYWVLRKPLRWPSQASSVTDSDAGNAEPFYSESLAGFLRDRHPDEEFPVLSSRQHNFGVVLHLEQSWFGLTVVAKSEVAYADFERLLELQLLHSYLECFVKGPPVHAITKLYGRTAIGKARLSVEVLRSTVCRTAGSGNTSRAQGSPGFNLCSSSVVVCHVILRVGFPPIFLPDILWCNGLTITADPYAQNEVEGGEERHGKLCCLGISFPPLGSNAVCQEPKVPDSWVLQEDDGMPCKERLQLLQLPLAPSFLTHTVLPLLTCR